MVRPFIARSERRRNHVATFDPVVGGGSYPRRRDRVVRAQAPQGVQNQGQAQQAASLPDGAAKELVARACTTCHGINQITNSTGYTKERWQSLFSTMIKLPDPQADSVAQYSAAHFPPKPGREPVLVPGPVQISFREWRADARPALPRSCAITRRDDLVGRSVRQRRRTTEPAHRRDARMDAAAGRPPT